MTAWLTNDVRRYIDQACSIIADIDIMGYRGGRVWGRVPALGGSFRN